MRPGSGTAVTMHPRDLWCIEDPRRLPRGVDGLGYDRRATGFTLLSGRTTGRTTGLSIILILAKQQDMMSLTLPRSSHIWTSGDLRHQLEFRMPLCRTHLHPVPPFHEPLGMSGLHATPTYMCQTRSCALAPLHVRPNSSLAHRRHGVSAVVLTPLPSRDGEASQGFQTISQHPARSLHTQTVRQGMTYCLDLPSVHHRPLFKSGL